jgi:hypothetical protein
MTWITSIAAAPDTSLKYEVKPVEIAYSASAGRLSIVRLTLSCVNEQDAPVAVKRITFVVPQGPAADERALTTDASLITVTPWPTTPWAVMAEGNGSWTAMPLPPATGVGPRETVQFLLSNVVVNQVAGDVQIQITENADPARKASTHVKKSRPSGNDDERPVIESFTADPPRVARGAEITLAWKVTGAESAVLQPGGIPIADPAGGCVVLPIYEATEFTLQVAGAGGLASAVAAATVMPVKIASFSAQPATPVPPGTEVTLSFRTEFASSVSIDQGIGPVRRTGEIVVRPTQTTIYTLTASGLAPQTGALLVTVAGAH